MSSDTSTDMDGGWLAFAWVSIVIARGAIDREHDRLTKPRHRLCSTVSGRDRINGKGEVMQMWK